MSKFKLYFNSRGSSNSTYAGFYNISPFFVTLTTDIMEPDASYQINWYAQNSQSAPKQIPENKWSILLPQWGFYDHNGEYVESTFTTLKQAISSNDSLISIGSFRSLSSTGSFKGLVHQASAYYKDDMPSTEGPINLVAVLETSGFSLSSDNPEVEMAGYSNSTVYGTMNHWISAAPIFNLKITQNGRTGIDFFRWTDIPSPYVITLHTNVDPSFKINTNLYGLTAVDPVLFYYPTESDSYRTIDRSIIGVSGVEWENGTDTCELSTSDDYGFRMGGFYRGYFTSNVSALSTQMYAELVDVGSTLIDENFDTFPIGRWSGYVFGFMSIPAYMVLSTTRLFWFWNLNKLSNYMGFYHSYQYTKSAGIIRSPITLQKNSEYELGFTFSYESASVVSAVNVGTVLDVYLCDKNISTVLAPSAQTIFSQNMYYSGGPSTSAFYFTITPTIDSNLVFAYRFDDAISNTYKPKFSIDSIKVSADSVYGYSDVFNLKTFERPYEIRRFNESWDSGDVIHSYALAEHTYSNPVLFDTFIEDSVGGLEAGVQSMGRQFYEKIANFLQNHSDVETANLNQLYSLAKETDVPIDDYRFSYPSELLRLVDIMSIHHDKLWGGNCKCNRNFEGLSECRVCGHNHATNRTMYAIDPSEYVVIAEVPFVVENIYATDKKYDLIYPSLCDTVGQPYAPLSALPSVSWLISSQYHKYSLYDYVPSFCEVQQEGVINWGDSYTTLSSAASTLEQWYMDDGLVEEMLNYELHRGIYNVQ